MDARQLILSQNKRRTKKVALGSLGEVMIRSITEGERSRMELKPADQRKAYLVCLSVIDEKSHEPCFDEKADVDRILDIDSAIIDALIDAIAEHNGFSASDQDALLKNYETGHDAGSSTD